MFYFYFIAHYYDVRHRYEDKMAIRVEADTLDEANVRAQIAALKVEIEYPYKRFRSLDLEQTIPLRSSQRKMNIRFPVCWRRCEYVISRRLRGSLHYRRTDH